MRVIRDNPDRQLLQSSVVTIGNFDGMHLGHQALINRCSSIADSQQPVAVVTFEPLPGTWFRPGTAPARLMSVRQKIAWRDNKDVDLVWIMRFNRALADMSPEDFVTSALVQVLNPIELVIGQDFHYGKARKGNKDSLRTAGEKHGFRLNTVATVEVDGKRASSSSVRECLAAGNLTQASRLLGRPYRTEGKVIRGRQLGRKLGYPTANMPLAVAPSPLQGIFAVQARWGNSGWRNGVANLGTRPVVSGEEFLIEVHLLDFDGDLYGQRMEVEYVKKLRNEEHFKDIDELVMQMREDERLARECLGSL